MPATLSSLVDVKARMLCYGVRCGTGLRAELAEDPSIDAGFIHGAVLAVDDQILVNTSVLDDAYSAHPEALTLRRMDDGQLVVGDDEHTVPVEVLRQPALASQPYKTGRVGDYLRLHSPTTLFATPVRQCAYIIAGRPCTFCTFEGGGRLLRLTPTELGDLVDRYRETQPRIQSVAFGGGSPNLLDFGASYYTSLATEVKVRASLDVSVEIVPAKRSQDWYGFLRSGAVDAVISSLEVWDDAVRERVCLGKSELSKRHYLQRWSEALDILGPGSVSSVLLAGLEELSSTLAGAHALIDHGVIPTIIPYRPYEASPLGPAAPVHHKEFLALSREVRAALRKAGLSPRQQAGCTSCGACSLELNERVASPAGVFVAVPDPGAIQDEVGLQTPATGDLTKP